MLRKSFLVASKSILLATLMGLLVAHKTASASDFPREIQASISAGTCTTPTIVQQQPTFSAFSYLDDGIEKYLMEFPLASASKELTNFTTISLFGSAWISANAVYDLTEERHHFTLYLDRVTPTPTNLWIFDSDGLDVGLSLTTDALFAGGGDYLFSDYDGKDVFDLSTHGDLPTDQLPFDQGFVPCLDSSCTVGARLNLLNMQYLGAGSIAVFTFDLTDERGLLYSQYRDYDFDDGWYTSQSYSVVPEPSVAILSLALFALGVITRRYASR